MLLAALAIPSRIGSVVEEKSSGSILIAVVDDDFRILGSLGSLLESTGYTAAVFRSGEAFLHSEAAQAVSCLLQIFECLKLMAWSCNDG